MSLEDNIKKWVSLDNNINKLYNQIKIFREKKNIMTHNIFKLLENKNVKKIKISDGNLQLNNSYSYEAITYKFLEECFNDYFNDSNNNEPHELLNFIKTKRNRTTVNSIKRFYDKEL